MSKPTFKVKWASREQAKKVAELLDSASGRKLDDLLKSYFGWDTDWPWMMEQPHRGSFTNLLDKRDIRFSKVEMKMLKTLSKDGFKFSHTDEKGFDVYVQESKRDGQNKLIQGQDLAGAAS